jgi:hypothetical protein
VSFLARFPRLREPGRLAGGRRKVPIPKPAAAASAEHDPFAMRREVRDKHLLPARAFRRFIGFAGQIDLDGLLHPGGRALQDGSVMAAQPQARRRFSRRNLLAGFLAILRLRGFHHGRRRRRLAGKPPDQGSAGDLHDNVPAGMAIHSLAHAVLPVLGDPARLIELLDQVVQVVTRLDDHVAAAAAIASIRPALGTKRFATKRNAAPASVAGARIDPDFVNKHAGQQKGRGAAPRPENNALVRR